ncbi:MAG: cytochrome c3 family protein [bacterium]|nr:cytochrome c3 family protein [bacterium]
MPGIRYRVLPFVLFASVLVMACAPRERTFRHEGHVVVVKGACASCHSRDPANPRPASTGDCAPCHPQAADPSNAGRYGLSDPPRTKRPKTYREVVFSHASHAASGVSCTACHGVKEGPGFPSMSGCAVCHEKEGGPTSCRSCHRRLPADAPAQTRAVR